MTRFGNKTRASLQHYSAALQSCFLKHLTFIRILHWPYCNFDNIWINYALSGRERGSLSCIEQQSEAERGRFVRRITWKNLNSQELGWRMCLGYTLYTLWAIVVSASDNILCFPVSLWGLEHQTWMSGVSCQNKDRQENRKQADRKEKDDRLAQRDGGKTSCHSDWYLHSEFLLSCCHHESLRN